MAIVFIAHDGDKITADNRPLIKIKKILGAPFHVTVEPSGDNIRRIDINSTSAITVDKKEVFLKVGEPLMIDPDFSIMITRIFHNVENYVRMSIRCPKHVELKKNGQKIEYT